MSTYILLSCPRCRRTLNVRAAYLGHWICCNHCDHSFLATEPSSGSGAARCEETTPSPSDDDPKLQAGFVESLEAGLQTACDENARLGIIVEVLKTELLERVSEADRLGRSAEELVAVRAERDLGEIERRTLSAMAEQLRTRLEEVEQLRVESERRYEAACREHEDQLDTALREWESKRRQLIAHGEEEVRSAREGMARLSDEVNALLTELATVRSDRDAALEHSGWLCQERDLLADSEGKWERALEETTGEHRTEIDAVASQLREMREELRLALEHETELNERLGIVTAELQAVRHELDAERQCHMEQTATLVQELEALFQDRLCDERNVAARKHEACQCEIDTLTTQHADARQQTLVLEGECSRLAVDLAGIHAQFQSHADQPPEAAESLRQEITALQDAVEQLRQERDAASEHAGTLRLERDQLRDSFARLQARLQEVEDTHPFATDAQPIAVAEPSARDATVIECMAEVVRETHAVYHAQALAIEEEPFALAAMVEACAEGPTASSSPESGEATEDRETPVSEEPNDQLTEDHDSVEHRIRSLREHIRGDDAGSNRRGGRRLLKRLARIMRSGESS